MFPLLIALLPGYLFLPNMLKKTLKWISILLIIGFSIECLRALPLLVPQPFFSHKVTIAEFTLYADSTIDSSTSALLQDAIDRVRQVEIYNTNRRHRIFLCYDERKYAFFSFLAGKNKFSQGINIEPTGNIFISKPFVDTIRARYGPAYTHTVLEGSIAHVMAHEIMHTLITNKLGYRHSRKLPTWKQEGYAEYGASKQTLTSNLSSSLLQQTHRFFTLDRRMISSMRLHYLRSKLLIQYLIEIEGKSFDTIMMGSIEEEPVTDDLEHWYNTQKTSLD